MSVIFGYAAEQGITLTEGARDAWSGAVYGGKLSVDVITKPLTGRGDEIVPLPEGATAPVSVTYNQLWEYGRKKLFPAGFAGVF